jgi:GTPase SAR1 family protein
MATTTIPTYHVAIIGPPRTGKVSFLARAATGMFVEVLDVTVADNTYRQQFSRNNHRLELITQRPLSSGNKAEVEFLAEKADAFFLIFSLSDRSSFESLQSYYYNLVYAKRGDIGYHPRPTVLVGTKGDLTDDRAVANEEAQNLANLWEFPFVEVSSKTGEHMDQVYDLLIQEIFKVQPPTPQAAPRSQRQPFLANCSIQ